MRNKVLVMFMLLTACAPLSPSIPKYPPCDVRDKAKTVKLQMTTDDVEGIMGVGHSDSYDSDSNLVWTYEGCSKAEFTFDSGNEVIKLVR